MVSIYKLRTTHCIRLEKIFIDKDIALVWCQIFIQVTGKGSLCLILCGVKGRKNAMREYLGGLLVVLVFIQPRLKTRQE